MIFIKKRNNNNFSKDEIKDRIKSYEKAYEEKLGKDARVDIGELHDSFWNDDREKLLSQFKHLDNVKLNIPEGFTKDHAKIASFLNRSGNIRYGNLPSVEIHDKQMKLMDEFLDYDFGPFNKDEVQKAIDLYKLQSPEVREKMAYNYNSKNKHIG